MSHRHVCPHLLTAALLAALIPAAHAGEFVYQGQLDDRGVPANGRYDLRIAAFGDEKSPQTLLAPIEFPGVDVKDGHFELRFDAPLAGDREAWLEVAVRDAGASAWAGIPGRSKALAAPLIGACWSSHRGFRHGLASQLPRNDRRAAAGTAHAWRSAPENPAQRCAGRGYLGSPINANIVAGSSSNFVGGATQVRGATISGGGAPEGDSDPDPEVVGEGSKPRQRPLRDRRRWHQQPRWKWRRWIRRMRCSRRWVAAAATSLAAGTAWWVVASAIMRRVSAAWWPAVRIQRRQWRQ